MTKKDNEPLGYTQDAIAWRVSSLETEVKTMRTEVIGKLDTMASNFVTHKDLEEAKAQAKEEHLVIEQKIDSTKNTLDQDINEVKLEVSALKRRNWVQNTLSAILGAVLAILTAYFLNGVIK